MRILGIDPSLRGTGWGILDVQGSRFESPAFGIIKNGATIRPSECLVSIRQSLCKVINDHQPNVVAIEGIIYVQNVRTALTMGQARGAAILAAAEAGLEIFEYAPRRVKQSVVGKGAAAKNQVGFMVRAMLGLTVIPEGDAADALAIALTHANSRDIGSERKSL
jgi:crossover junction endodeoxyribonuclease RuvC